MPNTFEPYMFASILHLSFSIDFLFIHICIEVDLAAPVIRYKTRDNKLSIDSNHPQIK